MKKLSLIVLLLGSIYTNSQNDQTSIVQNDQTDRFWDHVRFGGGLGLSFGSNSTVISIAPSAIYEFNETFALGVGTSYLYAKYNDIRSNVYGIGPIALYNPIQEIQLSAEFEQLFVTQKLSGFEDYKFNYPSLYMGAAYRSGWFALGLRYDVLYNENKSIYASPLLPFMRFYF